MSDCFSQEYTMITLLVGLNEFYKSLTASSTISKNLISVKSFLDLELP